MRSPDQKTMLEEVLAAESLQDLLRAVTDLPDVIPISTQRRPRCVSKLSFGGPRWEHARQHSQCRRSASYRVGGQPMCHQHTADICLNMLLGPIRKDRGN